MLYEIANLKPIGTLNNKYMLYKDLSMGGEGVVYLVKEKNSNNYYAAKIDKENNDFHNEIDFIDVLRRKGCQGIVNLIDSGEGEIRLFKDNFRITKKFLILELAENRDIGDYIFILKQGFEESFSKVIFYKILKCIQSIHQCEVCHLDIKLDNILFDDEFNPKICDFGFAMNYSPKLEQKKGTRCFLPPEIKEKVAYDGYQADIFSLGMALISLTTGKYRFYQPDSKNKFYHYIKNENKVEFWESFGEKINKSLSDELKDICFKMVSYDPEKRPTIKNIFEHPWIGNMTDEEMKKYENEIELKNALEYNRIKMINILRRKKEKNIEYEQKAYTKAFGDKIEIFFNSNAKAEFIEDIFFTNFYINIIGESDPVNFMNLLCNYIIKEFKKDDCFLEADKNNELKFDLTFENDESNMKVVLYQTSEGYVLRFLKKNMDKIEFFDKYEIIANLVEKI